MSKTYFVSVRGVGSVAGGALPHGDYIHIPTLNHQSPITVEKHRLEEIPIHIADDIDSAAAQSKTPTTTASIFILGDPASVDISLNGAPLTFSKSLNERADAAADRPEHILTAELPAGLLRKGRNVFTVHGSSTMTILDLWIDMEYPRL